MNFKLNYHIFAIISVLGWANGFVFTRLALQYFEPVSIAFLRYLLGSLVLLVVAIALKIKPPAREDWKWVILCGMSGFAVYMTIFVLVSVTINAATSSVIIATVPIFTALMAWVFYKEKLKPVQCFACGLEFLGILVMALIALQLDANIGAMLILLFGAGLLAIYNITTRKLVKKYSPLQVTIYSMFVGTIGLSIWIPNSISDIQSGIPPIGYFHIFVLGAFSSAIGFVTWALALKHTPKVSYVTNYMFITPFLTTLLGFWLANEVPGLETILGGALILSGLAIFNFHAEMAGWFNKLKPSAK